MPFLLYVAIIVVGLSTILLELNWLVSAPPQLPRAARTANTVVQAIPPAQRKQPDGPNADLSPVYPTPSAAPAETTGTTSVQPLNSRQPVVPAPAAAPPIAPAQTAAAPVNPAQNATAESPRNAEVKKPASAPTTQIATAHPAAGPGRDAKAHADTPTAADARSGSSAGSLADSPASKCNIRACAAAFSSFRESDCSYQPFDGPRRLCEKPVAGGQRAAHDKPAEARQRAGRDTADPGARKQSKDAELHQVERAVRRLTDRDSADVEADDSDAPAREIVVSRPRWHWRW